MAGYDDFFKQARKQSHKGGGAVRKSKAVRPMDQEARLQKALGFKKKKKIKVPLKLVVTSFVGFLIAGSGLFFLEEVEGLLEGVEVSAFGVAIAQGPGTQADPPTSQVPVKKKDEKADPLESKVSKAPFNDEQIDHLRHLRDRKKELDLREEELQKMAAELVKKQQELDKTLSSLQEVRRDIAAILQDRVKIDDEKVNKLVEFYSNMKPQMASKVFETLDEDLAVEVLGRMKKKDAAEIMNLLSPDKAQVLSEKFAGYKAK